MTVYSNQPISSSVTCGDNILASQYNNLRNDLFYNIHFNSDMLGYLYQGFDGDDDFVWFYLSTGVFTFMRFRIWPTTIFCDSGNDVTDDDHIEWLKDTDYDTVKGIASIGNYLYVWCQYNTDSQYYCVRIDKTSKSRTRMSFDGVDDPDNDEDNFVSTNGESLFVLDKGTTKLRKFTINGTTLEHDSNIVLPSAPSTAYDAMLIDDTYIWYIVSNGTDWGIQKCTLAGAKVKTTGVGYTNGKVKFRGLGWIHGVAHSCIGTHGSGANDYTGYVSPFYF